MSAIRKNQVEWRTSHRVMKRISQILGPFTPREILRFDPGEGFSTLDETPDEHGRLKIRPRGKPGFFEELYAELPRSVQRRFFLSKSEPTLTAQQRGKLEREILGHARRKLMRELTTRIKRLPHLVGNGPGGADKEERREIQKRVRKLTKQRDENGKKVSKRKAVATVAGDKRLSERQVWRIIRDT